MRIQEIRVKNFRCLRDVTIPLAETTVLIGENNAGKTALLDAIKLVLSRRWGQRGTGFTEYDFYMDDAVRNPRDSPGIMIELLFAESTPDEWPENLTADLEDLVQTDPRTDIDSITIRVECRHEAATNTTDPTFTFLDRTGQPLAGKARRSANLNRFFPYVPTFSLSALRDASGEFSARSQFWGQLLKEINVPDEQWAEIEGNLETLNNELLAADPKLANIRTKLATIKTIIAGQAAADVQIRALPMKVWDLLARAEVIVRSGARSPWLPLGRHGQGLQSLAVIYVFQAFVENLLAKTYKEESEPILLLEEPEAHLHPQAARTLGAEVSRLSGQKVVSTHSPFFMERVPFRDIRILRVAENGTTVHHLPASFRATVPGKRELDTVVLKHPDKLTFNPTTEELSVRGVLLEEEYRDLLRCFDSVEERADIHPRLRQLRDATQQYLGDEELHKLEEWARRIRGEIFFAKTWLLCEGQTEYILFHLFCNVLRFNLDSHGVSIIDYQNNGSPGAFAALGRALGFPWIMTCDGDQGGTEKKAQIVSRHFSEAEIEERVFQLAEPNIERHLLEHNLRPQLSAVLEGFGEVDLDQRSVEELVALLDNHKPLYAAKLAQRLQADVAGNIPVPDIFRIIVDRLRAQNQ